MNILLFLSGLYIMLGGVVLNTSNFKSTLLFRVIPFLIGLLILFVSAEMSGCIVNVGAQ